jgi:hypothetical protein
MAELDAHGDLKWRPEIEVDSGNPSFRRLVLRSSDPHDPVEVVGIWLVKPGTQPEDDAHAIVEEHDEPFAGSGLD